MPKMLSLPLVGSLPGVDSGQAGMTLFVIVSEGTQQNEKNIQLSFNLVAAVRRPLFSGADTPK